MVARRVLKLIMAIMCRNKGYTHTNLYVRRCAHCDACVPFRLCCLTIKSPFSAALAPGRAPLSHSRYCCPSSAPVESTVRTVRAHLHYVVQEAI